MSQHPGLLMILGGALFSVTVMAALTPPVEAPNPLERKIENLERASDAKIATLEREHDALETWADERLVPWVNRVADLQHKLAKALRHAAPSVAPLPSVSPLPPVPEPSPVPSPSVPPVSSVSPSPTCIVIPVSNVCLGTPSPPPHP